LRLELPLIQFRNLHRKPQTELLVCSTFCFPHLFTLLSTSLRQCRLLSAYFSPCCTLCCTPGALGGKNCWVTCNVHASLPGSFCNALRSAFGSLRLQLQRSLLLTCCSLRCFPCCPALPPFFQPCCIPRSKHRPALGLQLLALFK
jgi:hypothetical protein